MSIIFNACCQLDCNNKKWKTGSIIKTLVLCNAATNNKSFHISMANGYSQMFFFIGEVGGPLETNQLHWKNITKQQTTKIFQNMFELQTAISPQKSLEIVHLNAEKKGSRPE
jgi:hypothetical protein